MAIYGCSWSRSPNYGGTGQHQHCHDLKNGLLIVVAGCVVTKHIVGAPRSKNCCVVACRGSLNKLSQAQKSSRAQLCCYSENSTEHCHMNLSYRSPFQLAPESLGASRWSSNPVSWLVALCLPTEAKPYIKGQRGQKRQNGFGLLCGVWIWRVRLGWLLLYSSD